MPLGKRQKIQSFDRGSVQYKVNDCVLVRGDGDTLPYIGRIKDIYQTDKGVEVQVAWYYRPEEAMGGRKAFHGERELFKSDHVDACHASTIEGKCKVHALKQYQTLKHVSDTDYFARYHYKPATHEFKPDRVPVYCKCELPYNPDLFMVMCELCEEWYHPKCIGLKDSDFNRNQRNFNCDACVASNKGNAKVPRLS